jgi:hypothetical protein
MSRYGAAHRRWRLAVLARAGYRCQLCGDPAPVRATGPWPAGEADHIVPLAEGGAPLDPANGRALCRPCNRRRGGYTAQARQAAALGRATPSRWAATGAGLVVDTRVALVVLAVLVLAVVLSWSGRPTGRDPIAVAAVVVVLLLCAVLIAWALGW